jgi:hypothetical protein
MHLETITPHLKPILMKNILIFPTYLFLSKIEISCLPQYQNVTRLKEFPIELQQPLEKSQLQKAMVINN